MVQQVVAHVLFSEPEASGQGFLARVLIAAPNLNIGKRLRRGFAPAGQMAVRRFAEQSQGILETPMPTAENPRELTPPRFPLS